MLGNAIYGNTEGGIARTSLANGDPAEPVLLTVTPEGLSGTLNSVANESMRIEYFSTPRLPDGLVERAAGKVLLGSQTVTTDASGHAPLVFKGAMPRATRPLSRRPPPGFPPVTPRAFPTRWRPTPPRGPAASRHDPAGYGAVHHPRWHGLRVGPVALRDHRRPAHGVISGFDPQTGTLVYTPAAGYSGPDTFAFTVSDGHQSAAAPASVTIEVIAADPPDPGPGTDPGPGPGPEMSRPFPAWARAACWHCCAAWPIWPAAG